MKHSFTSGHLIPPSVIYSNLAMTEVGLEDSLVLLLFISIIPIQL